MDWSQFRSPAIDAGCARPRQPTENAQLAGRQRAAIGRALVDAVPWLPRYNLRAVVVLSRRVGGYGYHAITGPLIATSSAWHRGRALVTERTRPRGSG